MSNKKELLLPVLLLVLFCVVSVYIPVKYLGDFFFYRSLSTNGINTKAEITDKGVVRAGEFIQNGNSTASDRHIFKLQYSSPTDNGEHLCNAVVSKNVYKKYSVSDRIEILYTVPESKECFLPGNAKSLYILSLKAVCFGAVFLLLFLGFALHVYKSFKKRAKPVNLSTEFSTANGTISCPECGGEMTEGYIPGVGGINWRERNEPVGLPNMLTGLPGTIFWVKRPVLHAYNCGNCSVVTFRYNKIKKHPDK